MMMKVSLVDVVNQILVMVYKQYSKRKTDTIINLVIKNYHNSVSSFVGNFQSIAANKNHYLNSILSKMCQNSASKTVQRKEPIGGPGKHCVYNVSLRILMQYFQALLLPLSSVQFLDHYTVKIHTVI